MFLGIRNNVENVYVKNNKEIDAIMGKLICQSQIGLWYSTDGAMRSTASDSRDELEPKVIRIDT